MRRTFPRCNKSCEQPVNGEPIGVLRLDFAFAGTSAMRFGCGCRAHRFVDPVMAARIDGGADLVEQAPARKLRMPGQVLGDESLARVKLAGHRRAGEWARGPAHRSRSGCPEATQSWVVRQITPNQRDSPVFEMPWSR